MDADMNSDEENDEELNRPLVPNPVLFDADSDQRSQETFTDMPRAVQGLHDRDAEDVWAELG